MQSNESHRKPDESQMDVSNLDATNMDATNMDVTNLDVTNMDVTNNEMSHLSATDEGPTPRKNAIDSLKVSNTRLGEWIALFLH